MSSQSSLDRIATWARQHPLLAILAGGLLSLTAVCVACSGLLVMAGLVADSDKGTPAPTSAQAARSRLTPTPTVTLTPTPISTPRPTPTPTPKPTPTPTPRPMPTPTPLLERQVVVPPKEMYQTSIFIDYDATLMCTIAVTGGNNDINVRVLGADRQPIIEEPRLAGTNVVRVRVQGGQQYFLIFDNSFSTRTNKTVKVTCVAIPVAGVTATVLPSPTGEERAPSGAQLLTPTPTPRPTSTPTPAPPTPTPEPTPTPGLSADEQAYLAVVVDQLERMYDSLQRFSDPLNEAQRDPYVILDPGWKLKVATELAIWQATYNEAKNLTPPPRFAAFHQTYVSALEQFSLAADDFAYGVDHLDPGRINAAASRLQEGTRLLQEAMKQMPPH